MISSKMGRAERCRCTNSAKACLPCCQQVRRTLPIFDACGHRWPYDCLPSFCEPSPSAGWPARRGYWWHASQDGAEPAPLPVCWHPKPAPAWVRATGGGGRSEEHTSELQSLRHLVCRLLLEKKK